jgi:uncharacterized SAM-binding protein YcdF (DUF218 family)
MASFHSNTNLRGITMTGAGYSAFAKTVIGFWLAVIAAIAIFIAMIVFVPWLIPVIFVPLGIYIWLERRKNLKLRQK